MPSMNLPLPQQSYQAHSRPLSSQRLLNMFIEASQDSNASVKYSLRATPGLKTYYSLPGLTEVILCIANINQYLVIVNTQAVYVIKGGDNGAIFIKSATWESLGITAPSTKVSYATSGDEVILLNHEAGKLIIVEGDGDLPSGWNIRQPTGTEGTSDFFTSIAYLSGVYAASCNIASKAYVKFGDILDPDTFQYAFQLNTSLNFLTGIKANARELWCFTPKTVEVLQPTGQTGSDYLALIPGASINKGCLHYKSIVVFEDTFLFLGADDVVYQSQSYSLSPISTVAITEMIRSWGKADEVVGSFCSRNGHNFYFLKFKGLNKTLMYDITTKSWVERESGVGGDWEGELVSHQPNGQTFITSSSDSQIFVWDEDNYMDNGKIIRREFVFPTMMSENKRRVFYKSLLLDIDAGLGEDDTVALDWSDDGGYTWSKEMVAYLGEKGEYTKCIQFRRLGSAVARVFRIKVSTKNHFNVLLATLNAQEGSI